MPTKKKKPALEDIARDIAVRALKTAVQALGGGFITLVVAGDVTAIKVALMSAVAAGLSVAWNATLAYANK